MLFVGVSLSAQSYIPTKEALPKVQQELTSLTQSITATDLSNVKSIKIQFAKELLENLNKGISTETSLVNTNSVLSTRSQDKSYKNALSNADLYFKNLLK